MSPVLYDLWFKAQWTALVVGVIAFIAVLITDSAVLVWVVVPAVVVFFLANGICRFYYPEPNR